MGKILALTNITFNILCRKTSKSKTLNLEDPTNRQRVVDGRKIRDVNRKN